MNKYKITFSHSIEVKARDFYDAEEKAYKKFKKNLPTLYEIKTDWEQI